MSLFQAPAMLRHVFNMKDRKTEYERQMSDIGKKEQFGIELGKTYLID